MTSPFRSIVLSLVAGAAALVSTAPAFADGWGRPYYGPPPRHHHHFDGGDAAALGVVGLATGLIVGSAIAGNRAPEGPVYEPYPVDPYRQAPLPAPVYGEPDRNYYPAAPRRAAVTNYPAQALQPWSPAWYDYCASRYRTFDSRSGTFVGYDGGRHFCTAG